MNGHEDVNEGTSLPPMSKEAAVEYFSKSLLKNKDLDDDTKAIIEKLVVRLKCDPVALKLAVCYINEELLVLPGPLYIIENYFAKIDNTIIRDDRIVRELVESPSYRTLRVTCEKIREAPGIGEHALKVMEIISFLAADNIPTQLVLDLYNSMENQNNSTMENDIFQLLKRFSVINSSSGKTISVHPLIQQANRIHLEEQEKCTEILGRIQSCAYKTINKFGSEEMIHVKCIWDHVSKKSDLIKRGGEFPNSICSQLIKFGKYRDAFEFSCKVLPVLESTLTGKHRSTLHIKYWQGFALKYLGQYVKALKVLTEVYEDEMEIQGNGDYVLSTAIEIGIIHYSFGKYNEALKWYNTPPLKKRERLFGEEHPGALSLKNNIALVPVRQGNYEEAMEFYRRLMKIREKEWGIWGKKVLSALSTRQNLALVRFHQGNYDKALKMFLEILGTKERVLEMDHPSILDTKEGIADAYRFLGRKEEAVELYKEVLEKRKQILGKEHPETIKVRKSFEVAAGMK